MWEVGLPPSPVKFSQAFLLLLYWAVLLFQPATVFVYSSRGKWSSLLSCGGFLPLPLSQASPLLVAGRVPLLLPEPLLPTWLVYLQFIYSLGKVSLPTIFSTQGAPPSF
jgi:hypothetical protein